MLFASRNAQENKNFRESLKNSPMVIFTQDLDLVYRWIYNPAAGFDEKTVIGRTDYDLLPEKYASGLAEIKKQVILSGKSARKEVITLVSGKERYYDLFVEPLKSDKCETIGVACCCMDITESVIRRQTLDKQYQTINKLNRFMVNREMKIIELKDKIKELAAGKKISSRKAKGR